MTEVATKKPPLSQRLKDLLAEYGSIAIAIYLGLFALVFAAFLLAIFAGIKTGDSAGGITGTIVGAWVATKITQPFRIAGTLALTPLVGAVIARRRQGVEDVVVKYGDDGDDEYAGDEEE